MSGSIATERDVVPEGPSSFVRRRRIIAPAVVVPASLLAAVLAAPPASAAPAACALKPALGVLATCAVVGAGTVLVPSGATTATVTLNGGGGGGPAFGDKNGGRGARVQTKVTVTAGATLNVVVAAGGEARMGGGYSALSSGGTTIAVAGGGGGAAADADGGSGAAEGTVEGGSGGDKSVESDTHLIAAKGGIGAYGAGSGGAGGYLATAVLPSGSLTISGWAGAGQAWANGGAGGAGMQGIGGSGGAGYGGGGGGGAIGDPEVGAAAAGGGAGGSYANPSLTSATTYAPSGGSAGSGTGDGGAGSVSITFQGTGVTPRKQALKTAMGLSLALKANARMSGAKAALNGSGLKAKSRYTLDMRSTPVRLVTGTTDASGKFSRSFALPASVCQKPGLHQLILSGLAPNGSVLKQTRWVMLGSGCKVQGTSVAKPALNQPVRSFLFDYRSARLSTSDKAALRGMATSLKGVKEIRISGYTQTDRKGEASRQANIKLAQQRATVVRNYLRSVGVKAKVTLVARGPVDPVSTTQQKLNRRAVIAVRY